MKTESKAFLLLFIPAFIFSCQRKPTACIDQLSSGTYKVGDTITINSCSANATTYIWKIDDKHPNTFDDPFFGNHHAVDGGDGCDDFIKLYFFEAGTHTITLINPILKQGICSSAEKHWSRSDETSITINITN